MEETWMHTYKKRMITMMLENSENDYIVTYLNSCEKNCIPKLIVIIS